MKLVVKSGYVELRYETEEEKKAILNLKYCVSEFQIEGTANVNGISIVAKQGSNIGGASSDSDFDAE